MSLCTQCGLDLNGDTALCPHHLIAEDAWAISNRVMCDFFHRGIVRPRLSPQERDSDYVVGYSE